MKRPFARYVETRVAGCSLTEATKRGSRPDLAALRVNEVRTLLASRWGHTVPLLDDPDTRSLIIVFADLAAAAQRRVRPGRDSSPAAVERRVVDALLLVCPGLKAEAREIASMALDLRRKWTAEDLGEIFEITVEERISLGLTQMRPAGFGGEAWEAFRRERERARGERRRREAGARPKAEIEAAAEVLRDEIAAFREATGKSRRTFFLWRKAGRNWRKEIAPARPDQCSPIAPDGTVQSTGGAPSGAPRDPAAVLAEIVMRSTGVVPAIVTVEPREARVVFPPRYGVLGQALADHLGGTLAAIGFTTIATFDGRCGVHLRIDQEVA